MIERIENACVAERTRSFAVKGNIGSAGGAHKLPNLLNNAIILGLASRHVRVRITSSLQAQCQRKANWGPEERTGFRSSPLSRRFLRRPGSKLRTRLGVVFQRLRKRTPQFPRSSDPPSGLLARKGTVGWRKLDVAGVTRRARLPLGSMTASNSRGDAPCLLSQGSGAPGQLARKGEATPGMSACGSASNSSRSNRGCCCRRKPSIAVIAADWSA